MNLHTPSIRWYRLTVPTPDDNAPGKPEELVGRLDALRERLLQLSTEELQAGLKRLEASRKAELAERLKPFSTPVTESTMRRSARP